MIVSRYLTLSGYVLRTCLRATRQSSVILQYHTEHGVYGYAPKSDPTISAVTAEDNEQRCKNSSLYRFVEAYRQYGHLKASLDPLGLVNNKDRVFVQLDPSFYGLSTTSGEQYNLSGILKSGPPAASLKEVIDILEDTYCGPLTAEFNHLQTFEEKEWFATEYEALQKQQLDTSERVHLAKLMLKSQAFDQFLAAKFQSVKRYGGEGAESAMGFYDELFRLSAKGGVSDVMICIAHRGRLNLLSCLLNVSPVVLLTKMKGKREFPPNVVGAGDVLSHLTSSTYLSYEDKSVHVSMLPNPSHLEAINPVAVGKTRGRAQTRQVGDYATDQTTARPGDEVLCLQVHGDAAVSAQGIIAELFAIADTPHFRVGGSVHLVINNQLGYTTEAQRGRSSLYCTDIGKINSCPVIHVNGEYPEEVVKACRLAMAYRETFRRDIIIDLVCYRRWGHNELDEPSFTQPSMYKVIRNRRSIPNKYAEQLTEEGCCTTEELDQTVVEWSNFLSSELARLDTYETEAKHLEGAWTGLQQAPNSMAQWDTGVDTDLLKYVGAKSVEPPTDMVAHSTLLKSHRDRRLQKLEAGVDLDWATAEALAFGSLLAQDYHVRISGQDVGRGTFSQRHAMFVDQETDAASVPLNHILPEQKGFFEICNSALSEEAVLGFEYGMSIENPRTLVIWEAQFGDFFNGAQIIIDTCISGGETKWLLQSGLVMLLPHGMDGAGPEHSSCRIERFLQLTDSKEDGVDGEDVNMGVVNPTTPAQYFHLLRRQVVRPFRKPLVIAAPKMLLRYPACVSTLSHMSPGTSFLPVLQDEQVNPTKVTRVVLTSGKHYYTLIKEREERKAENVALIRVEELCPFPAEAIREAISTFSNATDFVWSQEEHRNMGAWSFINTRMENVVGKKLRYVGRIVHPTPATGVGQIHQEEAQAVLEATFS